MTGKKPFGVAFQRMGAWASAYTTKPQIFKFETKRERDEFIQFHERRMKRLGRGKLFYKTFGP